MFTGDQIKQKRLKEGLTVEELAHRLKLPVQSLYKWEKGTRPNNIEYYGILERWLGSGLESVPGALENNSTGDKLTNQIIFNLSESSREHATADRIRADAEILREQNNKKLIDLLISENAPKENQLAFGSKSGDLLEFLTDLGFGKRWQSREQVAAIVRNILYAPLREKQVGRTQKSLGTGHK